MTSEDLFNNLNITADTEHTTAISTIAYRIENLLFAGLEPLEIGEEINRMQERGNFPPDLELVDAFYDKWTSLSGVAFRVTDTDEVIVGFAGTNLTNGWIESGKDLWTNARIFLTGLQMDGRLAPVEEFMDGLEEQGLPVTQTTGHSLGGNIAAMAAMHHEVDQAVVYNAAPLAFDTLFADIAAGTLDLSPILPGRGRLRNRRSNRQNLEELSAQYGGRIHHFVSEMDWLDTLATQGQGFYNEERYRLFNQQGHGIQELNEKKNQRFIQQVMEMERNGQQRQGFSLDFDGDGKADLVLHPEELVPYSLFTGEALGSAGAGTLEVDAHHLNELAASFSRIRQDDLEWVKQAVAYCIAENEHIRSNQEQRFDQLTAQFLEELRAMSFFQLLERIEDSFGQLQKQTALLSELSAFSSYPVTRRFDALGQSGQYNWFADRQRWDGWAFSKCVSRLSQASSELLHMIRATGELTYAGAGFSGKHHLLQYDTYSDITREFVQTVNQLEPSLRALFEGIGPRSGKKDGIAEAVREVLEAEEHNIEQLITKTEQVKQVILDTAHHFQQMDNQLASSLTQGAVQDKQVDGSVAASYAVYLEESGILDDVSELLEAFHTQVQEKSWFLGRDAGDTFAELIGRFKKKGEGTLRSIRSFMGSLEEIDEWMDKRMTAQKRQWHAYGTQGDPEIIDHGLLYTHFPSGVLQAIEESQKRIVPLIAEFEDALTLAGTFETRVYDVHANLAHPIEEAVYASVEMEKIYQAQRGIKAIFHRLIAELKGVHSQLLEQASGASMEALRNELLELIQKMDYFVQKVEDHFGAESYVERPSTQGNRSFRK